MDMIVYGIVVVINLKYYNYSNKFLLHITTALKFIIRTKKDNKAVIIKPKTNELMNKPPIIKANSKLDQTRNSCKNFI